jgi:CheY-like chemotaxis protein
MRHPLYACRHNRCQSFEGSTSNRQLGIPPHAPLGCKALITHFVSQTETTFSRSGYAVYPMARSVAKAEAAFRGVEVLKRILIVDDYAPVRLALRRVIESVPEFEVCGEAENGRVGVERTLLLEPDLIILDFSMPVMNGLEAAKELNELMPLLPILMYTSFISSNLEAEAFAAGVSRVASKPSLPEALIKDLWILLAPAA